MNKPILYLSFDIETDGSNPLCNNMLSLGIYGLDKDDKEIMTFYANFNELEGHTQDKKCMEDFWAYNLIAWERTQQNKEDLCVIFERLSDILNNLTLEYKLEYLAMPACFDWMFLKSYYEYAKSNNENITYDIGFKCTCMSTLLKTYKIQQNMTSKQGNDFEQSLLPIDKSLIHDALYDAKIQGIRFVKLSRIMNLI